MRSRVVWNGFAMLCAGVAVVLGVPGAAVKAEPMQAVSPVKPGQPQLDCDSMLIVHDPADKTVEQFHVLTCESTLKLSGNPANPEIVLQLHQGVAAWWRQQFGEGSQAGQALAAGQLQASRHSTVQSVPSGKLLSSDMQLRVSGPKWIWDRHKGTLTGKDMAPDLDHNWYRVCISIGRGTLKLGLSGLELTPGTVFLSEPYKDDVRRGQPREVMKECLGNWSLSEGAPAIIHPHRGIGMVNEDARDGERFTVYTKVGDRTLSSEIRVYSAKAHPLPGFWRQVAEQACDGTGPRKPVTPITELRFRLDGTFDLTWVPKNHHYIDYAGTYVHNPENGEFQWVINSGQFMPSDAGASGIARVNTKGQLVISGLHPGTKVPGSDKLCELVFEK